MLALHPARQISALAARWRRSFSRSFMPRVRISAQRGPDHLPEDSYGSAGRRLHADVQMQVYTHRSASSSIVVPAVAEPMWVLVLSGAARVQERAFGQAWSAHDVGPDDFFLTMTHEPHPMQWQTLQGIEFRLVHVYLSQRLQDLAAQSVSTGLGKGFGFSKSRGARDAQIAALVRLLHQELVEGTAPNPLYIDGISQALAVHLVRCYRDGDTPLKQRNALPAYRLHRVPERMDLSLNSDFSLSTLAAEAGLRFLLRPSVPSGHGSFTLAVFHSTEAGLGSPVAVQYLSEHHRHSLGSRLRQPRAFCSGVPASHGHDASPISAEVTLVGQ